MSPVKVGISSCLLGEEVRYDGGHKRNGYITDVLARHVEFVAVCPEVDIGLGTPRDPIRLVADGDATRLVMPSTAADLTEKMVAYARRRVTLLAGEGIAGYILKKGSPSCGMERVKVYSDQGMPLRTEAGMFARELLAALPHLPVEEEGRLRDHVLRENFIERVFAYHRLAELFGSNWSLGELVAFHTRQKLTLMAHSQVHYKKLGRFVAEAKGLDPEAVAAGYREGFMEAMAIHATPKRHTNVLQHAFGYITGDLDYGSRHEILSVIEDYRAGLIPLIVPLTLIRHHVKRLDVRYLLDQIYLDPHPKELMLLNHV